MALPFSKMMSCGAISGCAGWAVSFLAAITRFACSASCRKAASDASSSASLGITLRAVLASILPSPICLKRHIAWRSSCFFERRGTPGSHALNRLHRTTNPMIAAINAPMEPNVSTPAATCSMVLLMVLLQVSIWCSLP